MWTIDLDRFALIELDPARPARCAIKDLTTGGLVVIDDDEHVVETVIMNMRSAGAPVVMSQEAEPK